MSNNIICNYYITEYESLLRTTEKLFKNKELQSYLTNEQNLVMYELLKTDDYEQKLSHWKDLLDGVLKLDLTLIETIANNEVPSDNDKESAVANPENNGAIVANNDDDEFIKMDLLNLQERLTSEGFMSALSLKVRYCLWEQPLKLWLQNDFKDGKLLKIYDNFKNVGSIDSSSNGGEEEEDYDDCYELLQDAKYVIREVAPTKEEIDNKQESTKDQQEQITDIKVMKDDDYDEEDDEYDMDNDDSDNKVSEDNKNDKNNKDDKYQQHILAIDISKDTLSLLLTEELKNDKQKVVSRFNNIYHTIEDDKTTVMGKLQLKEAEKRMEKNQRKRKRSDSDEEDDDDDDGYEDNITYQENKSNNFSEETPFSDKDKSTDTKETATNDLATSLALQKDITILKENNTRRKKKKSNLNGKNGEADIQISHLISTIEEHRSKLKLTDQELKKLLTDVQKTGSKWASDQKIGQEELYEACEKVLNQLRSYGSYCQPFMNKVSKREAPNYYDIIKQPMDLNTVLRKLRNIRYRSKQEFVDDLNLIWKNCLTYNTDTKLLIRRDCSMMQKKAASLISTIPDITIRDRKDVESELYEEEEDEDDAAKLNKDNANGTKQTGKSSKTKSKNEDIGKSVSRKGAGKSINLKKHDGLDESNTNLVSEVSEDKKITDSKEEISSNVKEKNDVTGSVIEEGEKNEKTLESNEEKKANVKKEAKEEEYEDEEEDMIDDDEDVQDTGYLQMLNAEQLAFIDDAELTTWKNMTSNARSDILLNRSQLFIGNKLNPLADALLRNNKKMKEDSRWLLDYSNELNLAQQKNGKLNGIHQINGNPIDDNSNNNDSGDLEDVKIGTDNLFFLNEYNITSNLPYLPYNAINNDDLEKIENFVVKQNIQKLEETNNDENSSLTKSSFAENRDIGMSGKMNANIKLIQEIRHICHKISLIRDLQNRQAALIASANNPHTKNAAAIKAKVFKPSIFRKRDIDTQVDIDFISKLPTRNAEMDQNLIESYMFKINSRIAMDCGFESTERTAISTLNEISTTYINNIIKTIKLHKESTSNNKIESETELVEVSLLQNGILRPDVLYSYYEKNFTKKQRKLKDIKYKLNAFLKKLLRPSLKNLSERNFDDESSSYLTGDFSNELTGDDFFGFKELGLDKEFNMMNKTIPLHLLAIQMADVTSGIGNRSIKLEEQEMELKLKDLVVGDLESDKIVGLMKPCLEDQWELNQKVLNIKKDVFEALPLEEREATVIKADEELPLKTKAVRLATNGRISLMKKKNINDTILLPEEEEEEKKEFKQVNNGVDEVKESENESISLSLPPINPPKDHLFFPTLSKTEPQNHGLVVPKRE